MSLILLVVMVLFDTNMVKAKPKAKGKDIGLANCEHNFCRLCWAWPLGLAGRGVQLSGVQPLPCQQDGPATVYED